MSELKKLVRSLERARNAKQRFVALEDLAEYYKSSGDHSHALSYYEEVFLAAEELDDDYKIAKAHRMIGEVQLELNKFDEALEHTKKFLDFAACDKGRLVELQRAYTTMGRTYLVKAGSLKDRNSPECVKVYPLAKDYLWKSLKLCEKLEKEIPALELTDMRARSMLNLGLTFEGCDELDEACKQFNVALRLCRKSKIDSTLIKCCKSLSSLYVRQGQFEAAFRLCQEAHATVKSLPEEEQIRETVEILYAESESHIWKGDVHAARKALLKAYKLLKPITEPHHVVERLKCVALMDAAQSQLESNFDDMSWEEKYKEYEYLGDGFASTSVGCYQLALENYEKMLECGKLAGRNLKPCYFSLAQTCKDLKDYGKAVQYIKEEISLCNSPKEKFDSLLILQECMDCLHEPVSSQIEILNQALKVAEECSSLKCKKIAVEKLKEIHMAAGNLDSARDATQKLEAFGDDSEEEEEESEIDKTPTLGEYIDLDALSDSSDAEEEGINVQSTFNIPEVPKTRRNPSRKRAPIKWRNDKGETKLHVACIQGNVNSVRTLLQLGSDINATDNVGWTPIHEACNRGHMEIVEILLEHGADVNSQGGSATGGITPLYDAGQAGNFQVMHFLLDHGASVNVLTKEGESALDALIAYHDRSIKKEELTAEDRHEYLGIKKRLETALKKSGSFIKEPNKCKLPTGPADMNEDYLTPSGKRVSPNSSAGKLRRCVEDTLLKRRTLREISPPAGSPQALSSDSSDTEIVENEGEKGVSEYIHAIKNLRTNTDMPGCSDKPKRKSIQPLLNEDEIIEDWLEDDVGKQLKKRRKSDQSMLNLSTTYKPLSLKRKSTSRLSLNSHSSSRASSTEPREDRLSVGSRNSDINDTFCRYSDGDEGMQIDRNEDNQEFNDSWLGNEDLPASDLFSDSHHRNLSNARQASLLSYGISRCQTPVPSQMSSQVSSLPSSIVNVKVETEVFAIFVENPFLSIGWLAEEAAKRYKRLNGCEPVLSIYSMDGALCSDDDPVKMVIGRDVEGRVKSWNDSLITERYEEACQVLSTESSADILSALETSQATNTLDVMNTLYDTNMFKPVFKAISMEISLSKIHLCNNVIDDKGVMELCENLRRLSNLEELDLSGNIISAQGVRDLANAADQGSLKALVSLNLSHNCLRNASLQYLVKLTASVPNLQNLYLCDCMFTKSIWDRFSEHLTLNKIQTLDLSYNQLHSKALAGFLGFFDPVKERKILPERLQNLYLLGLQGERICQEIYLFLEQGDSIALKELHLSYPSMQDEDLSHLWSILQGAPELHTVCLPAAQYVRAETVCNLLNREPPLKKLIVHNSKDIWRNASEPSILHAISEAARSGLESLTLRNVPEGGIESWCAIKGASSIVKRSAFDLQMFCKQ